MAADEVHGADPSLRVQLERHQLGHVLAIGCDRRVPAGTGPVRADALTADLPRWAWQRLSAGAGSHGHCFYDWAMITLTTSAHASQSECWWLLVRRHCDTGGHAYYRCYAPQPVPLRELVRVAGRRWTIEESFQTAKGLARLDEHQVRRWTSWQRWTLLAMLAHALLAVIAATEPPTATATAGLIALNCNEVRRLLLSFARPAPTFACPLAWSRWRRHHQHHARTSHYHRRGHTYEPA
ncbi:hypothetical protein [Streptomyces tendae]|uniref:hypothetical protein n=1 Tax=Streptomyces tendae TaxID=1932 RepID=UPI00381F373D